MHLIYRATSPPRALARKARMIDFQHMEHRSAASKVLWRAALAGCLCLLAFLFAVEAKTAWYGPVAGLGSNVRAAKAMPADTPRVIEHGIPVPDPIHPQVAFVLLPALALLWPSAKLPRRTEVSHARLRGFLLSIYSPHLSLRPPPALL